eukprot:s738_g30.t1
MLGTTLQLLGSSTAAPSSPLAANSSPSRSPQPVNEVKFDHRRTAGEVRRCKKGKRTDIKPHEWDKFGYAAKEEVLQRPIVYEGSTVPIPRVKASEMTPERFFKEVACQAQPIIIEDCCSHWPAMERWSMDALEERFRHVPFKVAKDDNGKKLRMKFKYFADYVRHQRDDNPLYLFETDMDDNAHIRPLMDDYQVPQYFPHDWFSLVNTDARPPFRWFCIGPKRSGTTVHTDPLGTAAWNAVTHGVKRWVLMEPHETKKRVKGKEFLQKGEDDEAVSLQIALVCTHCPDYGTESSDQEWIYGDERLISLVADAASTKDWAQDIEKVIGLPSRHFEQDFSRYVAVFVKETLADDAYFTGFIAVMAQYDSNHWGQVFHAAFTITILVFAIVCQASMIWFMRWDRFKAWNDMHDFMQAFLAEDPDIANDVSPWLLFVGLSIFLMQIAEEQKEVTIFVQAVDFVRSWKYPTRNLAVMSLQLAKCIMPILLRLAGIHVLLCSPDNMDVILNCTAFTFVFQIDNIAMRAACPRLTKPMYVFRERYLEIAAALKLEQDTSCAALFQALRVLFVSFLLGWLLVFHSSVLTQYAAALGF